MNVYEIVTDRILKELESGTVPWRRPWRTSAPANMVTKNAYRGVNVWLLGGSSFSSPYYGTFDQAKAAGGFVKKNEKSSPVVFWKTFKQTTDEGEEKDRFVLRYYNVFNIEQMELPQKVRAALEPPARAVPPIEAAEQALRSLQNPPKLTFGFEQAAYFPARDLIQMPDRSRFDRPEEYYGTLFHEEIHATGHKTRLDRPGITDAAATFGRLKANSSGCKRRTESRRLYPPG
jgi:antirestriction protein ArdC